MAQFITLRGFAAAYLVWYDWSGMDALRENLGTASEAGLCSYLAYLYKTQGAHDKMLVCDGMRMGLLLSQ